MDYKRVIDRCWEQEQDYFESLGLTKGMLKSIWDIYYNSVKQEVFNEDRTKLFIQHPNIGIFKHGLHNWQEGFQNLKSKFSPDKIKYSLKKTNSLPPVAQMFKDRYYPFVKKELDIMTYYMECYETYNQDTTRFPGITKSYNNILQTKKSSIEVYEAQVNKVMKKIEDLENKFAEKQKNNDESH